MIGELWARSAAKLGVAIALGALAPAGLVAAAPASGADAQDKGYLESTVRFLQEAQNPDGGFGATRSGPSDTDISAWAAIGLAAAGINPQEQARPGGRSVYDYLTEHADELSLTTDFERELLVVDAAGTSPYDFGGVDLVQRILERKVRGSGAFTHEEGQAAAQDVSDTVFAILALSPIHEPEVQEAVQGATKWLIEQQGPAKGPGEGSWNATCLPSMPACIEGEGPQGEVDMTAAAVEALNAAGNHGSEAQANALAFLHRAQESDEGDGGFREFFPGDLDEAPANAGSTTGPCRRCGRRGTPGIRALAGARHWRTQKSTPVFAPTPACQRLDRLSGGRKRRLGVDDRVHRGHVCRPGAAGPRPAAAPAVASAGLLATNRPARGACTVATVGSAAETRTRRDRRGRRTRRSASEPPAAWGSRLRARSGPEIRRCRSGGQPTGGERRAIFRGCAQPTAAQTDAAEATGAERESSATGRRERFAGRAAGCPGRDRSAAR